MVHRIVGTDSTYITHYELEVAEGKLWKNTLEATIGSRVAKDLGLKVGDTFFSSHGLTDGTNVHDNATFTSGRNS